MPGAAFDYGKGVSAFSEIVFDFAVLRRLWVGKIRRNNAAHGAYKLVHHAAGLAEILVFGALRHFCKGDGRHGFAEEKAVEYPADEHLKRGGGRKPAARGNLGFNICVKTAEYISAFNKTVAYSAYKRGGGACFRQFRSATR